LLKSAPAGSAGWPTPAIVRLRRSSLESHFRDVGLELSLARVDQGDDHET
jgi:hypothetical protein